MCSIFAWTTVRLSRSPARARPALDARTSKCGSSAQRGYYSSIFGAGRLEFVPLVGEPRVYPDLEEDAVYPHLAPATNLIDSVLNPLSNQSPATLGVAAMEVIEGATRSVKSGNNVLISSLVEQPA